MSADHWAALLIGVAVPVVLLFAAALAAIYDGSEK